MTSAWAIAPSRGLRRMGHQPPDRAVSAKVAGGPPTRGDRGTAAAGETRRRWVHPRIYETCYRFSPKYLARTSFAAARRRYAADRRHLYDLVNRPRRIVAPEVTSARNKSTAAIPVRSDIVYISVHQSPRVKTLFCFLHRRVPIHEKQPNSTEVMPTSCSMALFSRIRAPRQIYRWAANATNSLSSTLAARARGACPRPCNQRASVWRSHHLQFGQICIATCSLHRASSRRQV